MKIAVASDHGGFALKELVKKHLEQRNLEVLDLGTHSEESVDYPVYGRRCAEAVASGEADLGRLGGRQPDRRREIKSRGFAAGCAHLSRWRI